jgi:hypothetical protein
VGGGGHNWPLDEDSGGMEVSNHRQTRHGSAPAALGGKKFGLEIRIGGKLQ